MTTPPDHLKEKYNLFALTFEEDYQNRAEDRSMVVHVGRPISMKTLCDTFIFQHLELTVERSNGKLKTNKIIGIQKIPNQNSPKYELTADGLLKDLV